MNTDFPYEDILPLSRPVSLRHPPMPAAERAAQFSPFAALTGYGAAIEEAARLTQKRSELDEDGKAMLDEQLHLLQEHMDEQPLARITYFVPDEKKEGGAYVTALVRVRKIDTYQKLLILEDGSRLPLESLYEIRCEDYDLL